MLFGSLLRHRWKHLVRGGSSGTRVFKALVLSFFALYFGFSLAVIGYAFADVAGHLAPGQPPVALVSNYLFVAAFGYVGMRFFVQRPMKMDLQPYLHLPVPEGPLVRFAQVTSLGSLLNVFPLCFLGAFWIRLVLPEASLAGAFGWLAGVVLLLLITHYANSWLRMAVVHAPRRFVGAALVVAVLLGADALTGGQVLGRASARVFGGLLAGEALWLGPLAAALVALFIGSSRQFRRSLRGDAAEQPLLRLFDGRAAFGRSAVANLMRLDLKLVLRNRRPRTTVGIAVAVSVTYPPLLLLTSDHVSLTTSAIVSFFALIVGVSSYGQYLFSWDSEHFDGLMTRAISLRSVVRARLLLMHALSVATFALVLPFFLWQAPAFASTLGAFLLYAMGVACPSIFFVALWNYKRVHLNRSGMFNYEGLSFQQFLVNLPIFCPPVALFLMLPEAYAALAVGGLGVAGLALTPIWLRVFARRLAQRKYVMAAGFRSFDG